jgi:ABC-type polysaccharide transport system permease subunit
MYIDMTLTSNEKITMKDAIANVDWVGFINFIVLKTIPLFWIPAHTISFLMPENMRVMLAALLSIAFGVIVAYSKLRKTSKLAY